MIIIKKIDKIRFVREVDTSPDLSWIGEYSNSPKAGAIDREKNGDMKRGEFRYFNPANPEYAKQEYEHMEDIEQGRITFYGVFAEAIIYLSSVRQTIKSGGLWGIEYDGTKESKTYFVEEEKNQLAELKDILKDDLGFSSAKISEAVKNVEAAE